MNNSPVYLDFNATTPLDENVLEVMLPYLTSHFGNAASNNHYYGWQAAEAIDLARQQVAQAIGALPQEIIFTSGATEAINLAIKGVFEIYAGKGNHIITCATEHKAVLDTCSALEKKGALVTYLPVNDKGNIDLEKFERNITPNTILICLMYANNETGVIFPVKEIGAIAKKHNVLFFSDATQAFGKIPVNINIDNADIVAVSAHKIYGPKGTGALFVRRKNPRVSLSAQIHGGGHEKGLRSGTLNVPGIAGFGKASELVIQHIEQMAAIEDLRNLLENALLKLDDTTINGDANSRLPNTLNICFGEMNKTELIKELAKKIAVASGSACTSALPQPSHVLKAMGLSDIQAESSIRFSLGKTTTRDEIDFTIQFVQEVVNKIRG